MSDITLTLAHAAVDAATKKAAEVTGAVGVSGSSVEDDHAVAEAGVAAIS